MHNKYINIYRNFVKNKNFTKAIDAASKIKSKQKTVAKLFKILEKKGHGYKEAFEVAKNCFMSDKNDIQNEGLSLLKVLFEKNIYAYSSLSHN